MTWFQLIESPRDDPQPRRAPGPAPNSALFINPRQPPFGPGEPRVVEPRLRLIKG